MANQNTYSPEQLLVLDIETVPQFASFETVPETWKALWADKISKTMPENTSPAEMYQQRAGIQAEFGKIICITTGFFYKDTAGRRCLRVHSVGGDDEVHILQSFVQNAAAFRRKNPGFAFAGHNIREFDIPFICRRCMINGLQVPGFLQFSGLKPWEVNLVDTMQLWKFGDYKNYTSLQLLAACLGIPTPKQDMDGSKVKEVYYQDHDLERIKSYCAGDVVATAQVLLRLIDEPILPAEQIFIADAS